MSDVDSDLQVDFLAYEFFDQIKTLEPGVFTSLPNISNWMKRIEGLEQIDNYISSDRFRAWPINNRMAVWGGDK